MQRLTKDIRNMPTKSLKSRKNLLSNPQEQLKYLSNGIFGNGELPLFREKIATGGAAPLKPKKLEILQLNLGYMCTVSYTHLTLPTKRIV